MILAVPSKQAFCNSRILPSSPAFFRYRLNFLLTVSRAPMMIGTSTTFSHDGVRNLLTSLIGTVCTNVEVEPKLQPLNNERFNLRSEVTSSEARLDLKAGGFWSRGVTAFFMSE